MSQLFTKRHYKKIALILRDLKVPRSTMTDTTHRIIVENFVRAFVEDSPTLAEGFSPERFREAAGVSP